MWCKAENMSLSQTPYARWHFTLSFASSIRGGITGLESTSEKSREKVWDFLVGPVGTFSFHSWRALVQSLISEPRPNTPVLSFKKKRKLVVVPPSLGTQVKASLQETEPGKPDLYMSKVSSFHHVRNKVWYPSFPLGSSVVTLRTGSFERQWDSRCSWLRM